MKSFDQYSDLEIIDKIIAGDYKLFEILVRRNNPFLYKVGRSYSYGHEDTQDLMQDTFIDAYRHLKDYEGRSSFKTWIIRIMLNHCHRKGRKHSFTKEVKTDAAEGSIPLFADMSQADANNIVMNKELSTIIENALQRVPADYRMVFSLREITGLNVAETAGALEISETNVKVRLNRAKAMLRKEIERSYPAAEIFEFNLVYCDAMVNRVMNNMELTHQ